MCGYDEDEDYDGYGDCLVLLKRFGGTFQPLTIDGRTVRFQLLDEAIAEAAAQFAGRPGLQVAAVAAGDASDGPYEWMDFRPTPAEEAAFDLAADQITDTEWASPPDAPDGALARAAHRGG